MRARAMSYVLKIYQALVLACALFEVLYSDINSHINWVIRLFFESSRLSRVCVSFSVFRVYPLFVFVFCMPPSHWPYSV